MRGLCKGVGRSGGGPETRSKTRRSRVLMAGAAERGWRAEVSMHSKKAAVAGRRSSRRRALPRLPLFAVHLSRLSTTAKALTQLLLRGSTCRSTSPHGGETLGRRAAGRCARRMGSGRGQRRRTGHGDDSDRRMRRPAPLQNPRSGRETPLLGLPCGRGGSASPGDAHLATGHTPPPAPPTRHDAHSFPPYRHPRRRGLLCLLQVWAAALLLGGAQAARVWIR